MKFQHVQKKMTLVFYVFPKLETAKNVVRKISKKTRFKTPFDSQHVKGSQTLFKSATKHFYHIFLITLGYIKFENVPLSDI